MKNKYDITMDPKNQSICIPILNPDYANIYIYIYKIETYWENP